MSVLNVVLKKYFFYVTIFYLKLQRMRRVSDDVWECLETSGYTGSLLMCCLRSTTVLQPKIHVRGRIKCELGLPLMNTYFHDF